MRTHTFPAGTARTTVAVLDAGDDVLAELCDLAERASLGAAAVTAIGAVESATLGWYDLARRDYREIEVPDQAEVLTLAGDIVRGPDGGAAVHLHAVLGRQDGSTVGGHLLRATVRPVLEVVATENPGELTKSFRPEFGLALIDLPRESEEFDPKEEA